MINRSTLPFGAFFFTLSFIHLVVVSSLFFHHISIENIVDQQNKTLITPLAPRRAEDVPKLGGVSETERLGQNIRLARSNGIDYHQVLGRFKPTGREEVGKKKETDGTRIIGVRTHGAR